MKFFSGTSFLSGGSLFIAGTVFTVLASSAIAQAPWVAVAADGSGRWGASIQAAGSAVARRDAIRRCGSNCKVVMQGPGKCVAVAQSTTGGYWIGYAHGDNRNAVRRIALKGCADRAPPGSCRVEHINCLGQSQIID